MEIRTLEERARLALNCLARNVDANWSRLPYVWTYLKPSRPVARHGAGARLGAGAGDFADLTGRWIDALALARCMTGSTTAEETEGVLRHYFLTLLDDGDGLCYSEKTSWCEREVTIGGQRSALLALVTWFLDTGDDYLAWLAERLVRGLLSIGRIEGGALRFPNKVYRAGRWRSPTSGAAGFLNPGSLLTPVVRLYEASGSRDAHRLARLLANWIVSDDDWFAEDGSFAGNMAAAMGAAAGLLRAGLALDDERCLELGRRVYEWSRSITSSTGWMPETLGRHRLSEEGCNTCAVAEALDCALLLARMGHEACWDDAERIVRNQLVENQLADVRWVAAAKRRLGLAIKGKPKTETRTATYGDVLARVKGGFAGWAGPNDFIGAQHVKNWPMRHCCTASGVRALYLAWHNAVAERDAVVTVNLYFDRDTSAGELRTHLPYEGKLVFATARKRKLQVRLPAWCDAGALKVYVNAKRVAPKVRGRWLALDQLDGGDVVSVNYRLERREGWEVIGGRTFRLRWKGDTVTGIDPPGEIKPLYQRKDYEKDAAPSASPTLYMPKRELAW